jgi:hypothetical protein
VRVLAEGETMILEARERTEKTGDVLVGAASN